MFEKTSSELFFSKNDSKDIRFGDLAKNSKAEDSEFILYGYPDDRGVHNNGGRVGASEGPDSIRKLLYKMTSSARKDRNPTIADLGNLKLGKSIAEDHESAHSELIKYNDKRKIALGGGHDYSYPDGKTFLADSHKLKPVIINFDAHLDCRPYQDEVNSGTPFYRLLTDFPNQFDFFEIGLQEQCNSKEHYEWAKQKGLKALWLEDIYGAGKDPISLMQEFLSSALFQKRKAYISIDLDAYSSAFAPGCSQSWPTGLDPKDVWEILELIYERLDVRFLGIYECCPRLDLDDRTSRLASKIIHQYITKYS